MDHDALLGRRECATSWCTTPVDDSARGGLCTFCQYLELSNQGKEENQTLMSGEQEDTDRYSEITENVQYHSLPSRTVLGSSTKLWRQWDGIAATSAILHLLIVLAYLVLLIICTRHYEHALIISLSKQSSVNTALKFSAQAIVTIITTACLYTVQRLAIRNQVDNPEGTLTTAHDTETEWMGLGSAAMQLWYQMQFPVAVRRTLAAAAYLASITVLHVCTPALFNVESYQQFQEVNVTTRGVPVYAAGNSTAQRAILGQTGLPVIGRAYPMQYEYPVSAINYMFQNRLHGLVDGLLYDVPDGATNATIDIEVGGTYFNTTCGYCTSDVLPDFMLGNFSLPPPDFVQRYKVEVRQDEMNITASMIITTHYPILDSDGITPSSIQGEDLSKLWKQFRNKAENRTDIFSNYNVIGCNMTISHPNVMVDPKTRLITSDISNLTKTTSKWQKFPVERRTYAYEPTNPDDIMLTWWGGLNLEGPYRDVGKSNWGDIYGTGVHYTAYVRSFMEGLGLPSPGDLDQLDAKIYLHDLENFISKQVATSYWIDLHTARLDGGIQPTALESWVMGVQEQSVGRINLNTVPLIIGLLASLWLAAIAASVIAVKQQPFSLAMDTLGILDVMWLLYRNHWDSDGWNISPTTHELRRIGQDMKLHSNLTQAQMQDQMKSSSRNSSFSREDSLYTFSAKGSTSRQFDWMKWVCAGSHVTLLAILLALVGVWAASLEHNIAFPLEEQNSSSVKVTVVLQIFGLLYCAVMLYTAQQLVVRNRLYFRHTATAIHDVDASWLGLGSAFMSIFNQFKLSTDVVGVVFALVYLTGMAVLQAALPSLASVVAYNYTSASLFEMEGIPVYSIYGNTTVDGWTFNHDGGQDVVSELGKIDIFSDPEQTPGLLGGILYDVPVGNSTEALHMTVNAAYFNVSCNTRSPYTITLGPMPDSIAPIFTVDPLDFSTDTSRIPPLPGDVFAVDSDAFPPDNVPDNQTLMMLVPNHVVDSAGQLGPIFSLNPPFNTTRVADNMTLSVSDWTLVQCRVKVDRFALPLDPVKKTMSQDYMAEGLRSRVSSIFVDNADAQNVFNSSDPYDMLELKWAGMLYTSSIVPTLSRPIEAYTRSLQSPRSVEATIGKLINEGIPPDGNKIPDIELVKLENAMANVTAMMFWIDSHTQPHMWEVWDRAEEEAKHPGTIAPIPLSEHASAEVLRRGARVELSIAPIALSVAISAILTFLALYYIWNAGHQQGSIDNLGVLQVIWLIQDHTETVQRIGVVENPTTDNLRAAGTVIMDLGIRIRNEPTVHDE